MKAPKRSHTKSRAGCLTCRSRRVKCDEVRPMCSNCSRRQIDCSWADENTPSSSRQGSRSPNALVLSSMLQSSPSMDMTTLELFHHYTSVVSELFGAPGQDRREHIPRLAFMDGNYFLMHAVLAIAALHKHQNQNTNPPTNSYITFAEFHYNQAELAVDTWLDHSPTMNERKVAIYVANTFLAQYMFAINMDTSLSTVQMMHTIRRVPIILTGAIWPHVQNGTIEHFLDPSILFTMSQLPGPTYSHFPDALLTIHIPFSSFEDELDPIEILDPLTSAAYEHAVRMLRTLWIASLHPDYQHFTMVMWPSLVTDTFARFLMERRPRALIIHAHFCAIVTQLERQHPKNYQWNRGRFTQDIMEIKDIIGQTCSHWLHWPLNLPSPLDVGNPLSPWRYSPPENLSIRLREEPIFVCEQGSPARFVSR